MKRKTLTYGLRFIALVTVIILAAALYIYTQRKTDRMELIGDWFANPATHNDWLMSGNTTCPGAPMLFPSDGFVGVGWSDGIPPLYQHTGYDIFSPAGADNITPIFAAYDGYLTRENNWLSTVIIRHPDFNELPELTNGDQIWTYYTHMASADGNEVYVSPDFPPGTREKFVTAGTLLGYQGTWSGTPERPVGLHLHFSVVKTLPSGGYDNETILENTYNPGPFLGTEIQEDGIIRCKNG